ncbi:hypothetical protein ACFFU9_13380 [Mariniflexile ostreae]|uniref:Uncharacterized protein n=1 Tax=Mariniflexile ostreae TaxID=1520892 RepID=A0ABV5FE67_9FLAO
MNKSTKILILLIICFEFINCKSKNELITISQTTPDEQIIVRLTLEDTTVLSIKFPNSLVIKNNSYLEKSFVKIDYHYTETQSKWRNLGIRLYESKENILKPISTTGKKTLLRNESLQYTYYTRHYIDSSKAVQLQFKPYIKKMLNQKKDTLHIGTVAEFKKIHKELFEKLTKNDSISIQFLDGKKLGERITVPVEW